MNLPTKFVERTEDYPCVYASVNFIGNAALATVYGIFLATISCLAFKALGFEEAEIITTAIRGKMGTVAAIAVPSIALFVAACVVFVCIHLGKALDRR